MFELNYRGLEEAVKKAKFNGADKPDRLYDLVAGDDALPEPMFVDRVNRNLREGRIVVLIVGDGIRTNAEALVAGLQAHANFHFTFALVEMPVYSRSLPGTADEFIVVPGTLLKTVTVPRYTISSVGEAIVDSDAGVDDSEANKPSRQTNVSSEEFFEELRSRAADAPEKLKQFLDDIHAIDIRAEFLRSLNLKWDQPDGKPVNLGYILRTGDVWTDSIYGQVDNDLAADYNSALAKLFGGKVRKGLKKKDGSVPHWVTTRYSWRLP